MDVESLKEVIAAFQSLGGDAKEAFGWYLLVAYLPGYVIGATWTVGGLLIVHRALKFLTGLAPSGRLLEAYGSRIQWDNEELNDACSILRKARAERSR